MLKQRSAFLIGLVLVLLVATVAPAHAGISPTRPPSFFSGPSGSLASARVSGSGSHLVRVDQRGDVVLTSLSTNEEWVVATGAKGPVLSDNGRFVAYLKAGTLYRWDRQTRAGEPISAGRSRASEPSMSDDGSVIAWHESGPGVGTVAVWRESEGVVGAQSGEHPVLSGDGRYLFHDSPDEPPHRRWDLTTNSTSTFFFTATSVSDDGSLATGLDNPYLFVGRETVAYGEAGVGASWAEGIGDPSVPIMQGGGDNAFFATVIPAGSLNDLQGTGGRYETYRTNFRTGFEYVVNAGTPIDVSDDGNKILSLVDEPASTRYRLIDISPPPPAPPIDRMRGPQLSDQTSRLYTAYFSRIPDADGLRYWNEQRAAQLSLDDVSASFAASPEFAATYGQTSDAEFVDLVYTNVLGRLPDEAGRSFWVAELRTGLPRGTLMTNFSESPEYVAATMTSPAVDPGAAQVWRLFRAYFQRDADQAGLNFWYGQRFVGLSLDDVSASFAASPEFAATYGQTSDAEFVDLVYTNVLGRLPDEAGRSFWVAELRTGLPRGTLMTNFSESPEYIIGTDTMPPR